jgi:2-methylisocitrate lyase-like PEP mutase family enzyme
MTAQSEKAKQFAALHRAKVGFILPNPWDRGSARIMAHHGFLALATSSAAHANSLGRGDYQVTREEALVHCRELADATDLPVTADLENCFADKPIGVADMVLEATETGIVGCSVEDATRDGGVPLYPFEIAVERVAFAVKAARRVGFPFTITARTEEMFHGGKDIKEAIRRLKAFEKVGADVVYATGITTMDQVRQIKSEIPSTPLNVMAMKTLDANQLLEAGVTRVSLGPWFARAAMQGLLSAIEEVKTSGTFTFAENVPTGAAIAEMLRNSGGR